MAVKVRKDFSRVEGNIGGSEAAKDYVRGDGKK